MDQMEIKGPAQPDVNELREEYEALRHLVVSILVLALVVSGTLTIYLLRQWRFTHTELLATRPVAQPVIANYQKAGPAMDQFLNRLADYGRTHPDVIPVLTRYGLRPVAASGAPPGSVSAPKAAPLKK
jgi:hypothetical protein